MLGLQIALTIFLIILSFSALIGGICLVMLFDDRCKHSMEKIDSAGEYVILVCRKCGKVKKVKR